MRLTPEGEQLVDTVFPRQLAREAELLAGLDDARATVVADLNTLVTTLGRSAHREH